MKTGEFLLLTHTSPPCPSKHLSPSLLLAGDEKGRTAWDSGNGGGHCRQLVDGDSVQNKQIHILQILNFIHADSDEESLQCIVSSLCRDKSQVVSAKLEILWPIMEILNIYLINLSFYFVLSYWHQRCSQTTCDLDNHPIQPNPITFTYIGQIPQDGENGQNMAFFYFF